MQKALSPWKSYGNRGILFAAIEQLPLNMMWLYVHVQCVTGTQPHKNSGQILSSSVQQGQTKPPEVLVLKLTRRNVEEPFWIKFRGKTKFKENLNYPNLNLITPHSLPATNQVLTSFPHPTAHISSDSGTLNHTACYRVIVTHVSRGKKKGVWWEHW